jgi:hypothetical protein
MANRTDVTRIRGRLAGRGADPARRTAPNGGSSMGETHVIQLEAAHKQGEFARAAARERTIRSAARTDRQALGSQGRPAWLESPCLAPPRWFTPGRAWRWLAGGWRRAAT